MPKARSVEARPQKWEQYRVPGLVLASAVLMCAAFPPFHLGFLVFVALTPWLISLRDATPRQAWRRGYGLGLAFALVQLIWIPTLIQRWVGQPVLAVLPWLLACALMAIYFGLAGFAIQKLYQRGWLWMIPIVWAGMEGFRAYFPVLAFPWSLMGTALWRQPLFLQPAWLGSVTLVSAWAVLGSVIFAAFLTDEPRQRWRVPMLGFGVMLVISLLLLDRHPPTEPASQALRVSVVQPAVDMAFGNPETLESRLSTTIEPLLNRASAQGSEIAVLPEGVAAPSSTASVSFQIPPDLSLVYGGQRISSNATYQTAFAISGGQGSYADKTRLVIFGEFVPGRSLFPGLKDVFRLPAGDLSAGTELKTVQAGATKVGPLVCFEGLFPDLAWRQSRSNPAFLAVMSNDDWFQGTPAMEQLRAASAIRAVEAGRPLVRAGSLGYSIGVAPSGEVLGEAPFGKSVSMALALPRQMVGPFPLFPVFPVAATLCFLGMLFVRNPKSDVAES